MVRTAIACAPCRKQKIKCVHEGTPPCRNCFKKGRTETGQCILTGPHITRKFTRRPRRSTADTSDIGPAGLATRDVNNPASARPDSSDPLQPGPILSRIPDHVVTLAFSTFTRKFPELRFLHWPTVSRSIKRMGVRNEEANEHDVSEASLELLCLSVLAATLPMLHKDNEIPAAENIAKYARGRIRIGDPPNLLTVQALLALSMYEWGSGNGYRAWTYSGMAIRMMQSLCTIGHTKSLEDIDLEVHNRTLWGCFIMDRLVFSGKPQPFTLTLYSLHTHWPVGEDDFAFGQHSGDVHQTDEEQGPLEHMEADMNNYYSILVRGFDIWARILSWIVSGGRRLPGMSLPGNQPWMVGSRWRLLYDELQAWRRHQEKRLHYPSTSVHGHAALGRAEPFVYINLIYYVGMLFLGREYLRFLPTPDSEPCGPVDAPLLPLQAPPGWWHDRADELFTSAAQIVSLLSELDEADASLYTPFTGFCGFSAATMNIYVSCFPNMNLNRSQNMQEVVSTNLAFLDKFRKVWPMGEGWWVTIHHCKMLYETASANGANFVGRTRADFEDLEYSIHDTRGKPPTQDQSSPHEAEVVDQDDTMINTNHDTAAALRMQELSGSFEGNETAAVYLAGDQDWGQIWPLWGEQDNVPFAIEGIPFEYIDRRS